MKETTVSGICRENVKIQQERFPSHIVKATLNSSLKELYSEEKTVKEIMDPMSNLLIERKFSLVNTTKPELFDSFGQEPEPGQE